MLASHLGEDWFLEWLWPLAFGYGYLGRHDRRHCDRTCARSVESAGEEFIDLDLRLNVFHVPVGQQGRGVCVNDRELKVS